MKRSLIEPSNGTILGTCALGIDHDAVSTIHQRAEFGQYGIYTHRDRIVFGISYDHTKERTVPHPIVRQDYQFAGLGEHDHQIEMRLMIAYYYCRPVEVLTVVLNTISDSRDTMSQDNKLRHGIQQAMQYGRGLLTANPRCPQDKSYWK